MIITDEQSDGITEGKVKADVLAFLLLVPLINDEGLSDKTKSHAPRSACSPSVLIVKVFIDIYSR